MVIGGLDGGVGGKDHNLAFAINNFTIGAERIGSNGNSGSGTLQFSQLRVDLDLGSSVAELMDRVGSNTAFSVQIVGDDPKVKGKSIVYDLRLDAAVLQSLATGQGKGHDALVFNYGDYSITTRNGAGETDTTGLNRTTTEILTEPLTAAEGANRGALPDQPMKYYLVLDGIDGGSTAKGHKGAFEIDSFDFDMFRQSNRAFSGVDLKLDLGSAEDEIMRLAASGAFLQTAQIVGDTLGKNGKPGVYDLRLGDVIVSGLTHNAGPRDGLSLKYGDMSLSTKNEKGLVSTSGYDFGTRNTTTTRLEAPEAKTDDNWLGAGKTTYWLVLDGVSSGAGGKQHAGAFALDGFDFSVLNNTAGGSGSGSGSGRPLFLPLQAMLDSGTAADELLGLIAKGMHISSAQIIGEAKVGKSVETVYDLRLSDVIVTDYGLLDNNSIAFDYEAFTVSTMNRKGQMETAGLDITHGTLLTTPLDL